MDSMEFNKIAGIILAALLVMFGGSTLIHEVTANHGPPKGGWDLSGVVDTSASTIKTEAPPEQPIYEQVQPLLASAEVKAGERVFAKCKACHTVNDGGANKIGPNLWNVVNRKKGAMDGFKYSTAMAEKAGEWTYENLAGFLHKPKDWLPGTKMVFVGLKKPEDVASVIAYLRSLATEPAPLP